MTDRSRPPLSIRTRRVIEQLLHLLVLVFATLQPGALECFGGCVVDPLSTRATTRSRGEDCFRVDPL